MKNLTVLLSITMFVVFFAACGNDKKNDGEEAKKEVVKTPEDEAQELMTRKEEFTAIITEVAADKSISDDEAKKIVKYGDDFDKFNAELKEKYAEGSDGKAKIDAYFEKNKPQMEKIYSELMNAMMTISMCEGYDKLQDPNEEDMNSNK